MVIAHHVDLFISFFKRGSADASDWPECSAVISVLCVSACLQRVVELEKENALLKSEKEELNQQILQRSSSTEGEG